MVLRHLAEVERHIVQGETHLAKQSALIAELERHGHDTRGRPSGAHHHERNAGAPPAGSGTHFEGTARVRPRGKSICECQSSEPLFDLSVRIVVSQQGDLMLQIESSQSALSRSPSCPSCGSSSRFVESLWNIDTRTRVRIFECETCRKLIWDDQGNLSPSLTKSQKANIAGS